MYQTLVWCVLVSPTFQPREYQQQILQKTIRHLNDQHNVLIELDCGLGKRYLMMKLIEHLHSKGKILVLLQTRSSLFETFDSFRDFFQDTLSIGLIHSQQSSRQRTYYLEKSDIIVSLPITIRNALRKTAVVFKYVIINEVDTLVRRQGNSGYTLKQPYNTLFGMLLNAQIIGLSGTLRDDHYEITEQQILIKKDLEALQAFIPKSHLITMDSILEDAKNYIQVTHVNPIGVHDSFIEKLYEIIEENLETIKQVFNEKHGDAKTPLFLRGMEVEDEEDEILLMRYGKALMLRKYLYAFTKTKIKQHFYIYYQDNPEKKQELKQLFKSFLGFTAKTQVLPSLFKNHQKIIVLMTYLAIVEEVKEYLILHDYKVFTLTGKTRDKTQVITSFLQEESPAVLLLSNVGERDLDLVQADLLVLYDVVNTVKTVYQKLKRSRFGDTYILYYENTSEKKKVQRVLKNIMKKYYWSTEINLPVE